jgi:Ca2+-binding EF-hand superfamily protein
MFALTRFEWLALAAAVLACPALSWAQAGAGATVPSQSLFDRLDKNKDGYLTADELSADEANNRNWIAIDRDRDGRISRSEFGLVGVDTAKSQPSAAAGGSAAPKKPE